MADYIPFVNSSSGCSILDKHYQDAHIVRVSLDKIKRIQADIPSRIPLWLDPAVDAYHHLRTGTWPSDKARWNEWQKGTRKNWERCFKPIAHHEVLLQEKPWVKQHRDKVDHFVAALLKNCLGFRPKWITAPQLPLSKGVGRTNNCLVQATGRWKENSAANVKLVLPVIISDSNVLNTKSSRDKVATETGKRLRKARAEVLWVVDTSLADHHRNAQFPKRYRNLIEFHSLLNEYLPTGTTTVGGPYWGINLVLWARKLCTFPAVSLGTTYTYHYSCGQPRPGNIRLAIPPIRRWVIQKNELKDWLEKAMGRLSPSDPAYRELSELRNNIVAFRDRRGAVTQVAKFYNEWLRRIQGVAPEGRSLALYQDLSSAYVIGRQLPPLPKEVLSTSAPMEIREAGKVAEQLMLYCL